jgi:hypothetical protein
MEEDSLLLDLKRALYRSARTAIRRSGAPATPRADVHAQMARWISGNIAGRAARQKGPQRRGTQQMKDVGRE